MADTDSDTSEFVSLKHIPALIKELVRIRKQRQSEFDRVADQFGDPLELARLYVEPECQQENPANMPNDELQADHRTSAFQTINRFLSKSHLDRDGRNHKIILADAGMGKSSLIIMLWSFYRAKFWPSSAGCELLKIGPETLHDISKIEAKSRTILLLDALDEDPTLLDRKDAKARLIELIDATLAFRKVIISCRTQFFVDEENDPDFRLGHVRLGGYSCSISYLSPFDDRQSKALLKKRFPDAWHSFITGQNKTRLQALSISSKMGTLRMRPLLLAYIPLLLEKDEHGRGIADLGNRLTEYDIYEYMVTRWLDREAVKLRLADPLLSADERLLRTICWEIAYELQQAGDRCMISAAFEAIRTKLKAPQFLKGQIEGRTLLNKDSSGHFRFAHYSIQEFLTVEYCLVSGPLFGRAGEPTGLVVTPLMTALCGQRLNNAHKALMALLSQPGGKGHSSAVALTHWVLHPTSLVAAARVWPMGQSATLEAHALHARERMQQWWASSQPDGSAISSLRSLVRQNINELINKSEGLSDTEIDNVLAGIPLVDPEAQSYLMTMIRMVCVGLQDLNLSEDQVTMALSGVE